MVGIPQLRFLTLSFLVVSFQSAGAQVPDWTHTEPLPKPSGRFPVGVTTVHMVDSSRPTSRHIPARPLVVQVWYPARRTSLVTGAPYLTEAALLDSMMERQYLDLKPKEMEGWRALRVSAVADAASEIPPTDGWPVLVFSHGLGAARANYSALSQELASHGFVVLTLDHPLGGFTLGLDGAVLTPGADSVPLHYGDEVLGAAVRDWALDAEFVVRSLAATSGPPDTAVDLPVLDTTRVGMLGHSLGGAAALQACLSIPLVRGCANMDGYPFGDVERQGVGDPFLVLLSEPDHDNRPPPRDSAEATARERFAQMGRERDGLFQATCDLDRRAPCFVRKLKGTGHFSFSDMPFQGPSLLQGVWATLPPRRQHELITESLLEFFDHVLRGQALQSLRPGLTGGP